MTKISNKVVLITGGASGIGKILGQKCLQKGASDLIIWDINQDNLDAVSAELRREGYRVHAYRVDVSSLDDIKTAATDVLAEIGTVDILFNNAGIVVGNKYFDEHSHEDIERTLDINVAGVMHIARVFIGGMLDKRGGHIINIASASSLTPNPRMSVYAGSKWAVLGWSESLRIEMEKKNSNVQVTTVMPSYIKTGMFEGVTAPLLTPLLEPEDICNSIIEAVENNEILVSEPLMVKFLPLLRGVLPARMYDFLAENVFEVYNSMDKFIGRNGRNVEVAERKRDNAPLSGAVEEKEIEPLS
ncbi:SDR family NAD(P)-dependent oxidoreductase [Hugenholtzia roseola]|uniref:SDR family NAD(P)-dependent oxidoreductase n=1 Tax=Hugenholtzia roseola TaxID=1002 RepID=UPI0003FA63F5|nr:SDR family NAD(P)-dependent oxidoreductase [Hugenholtzia roseola]